MENNKRIVITGPESTGKTYIAGYLAKRFKCTWIPEYARTYIENLNRPYNYSDIENIAKKQIEDYLKCKNDRMIIFDTWLIITKVWFLVVYGRYPEWLNYSIKDNKIDLFLLCAPDIDWYPDPVRENGGEFRDKLFRMYEKEIILTDVSYKIVTGKGKDRCTCAENFVREKFNL